MKILIVGNGGREHAIAYELAGLKGTDLYATRPNAGLGQIAKAVDIDPMDITKLVAFAKEEGIQLTVVGPEAPLAAGIVDTFEKEGLRCFGPNKKAARLESSKAFAHKVMQESGVPCAQWKVFDEFDAAVKYIKDHGAPIVVKADGLAAGKGVVVAMDEDTAIDALKGMMIDKKFGESGTKVVIEEFLEGEEFSFMVISDGERVIPLPVAKDYKRLMDGNKGPNTGGMGAISPVPFVDEQKKEYVLNRIIMPVIDYMAEHDMPFKGVLYAGLIDTKEGPKVLEFNVRLGDPEAQVVLPRVHGHLLEAFIASVEGDLSGVHIEDGPHDAVVVVMASRGYPKSYKKGFEIKGLDDVLVNPMNYVYHAGTVVRNGNVVTNGGRVLGVLGLGRDLKEARATAYEGVEKIHFEGAVYRKDIGLFQL